MVKPPVPVFYEIQSVCFNTADLFFLFPTGLGIVTGVCYIIEHSPESKHTTPSATLEGLREKLEYFEIYKGTIIRRELTIYGEGKEAVEIEIEQRQGYWRGLGRTWKR